MELHERLHDELSRLHSKLLDSGELPSRDRLAHYYQTFRARFGPEQLARLDGDVLLQTLHDFGNRESLVYWLEFKDDDEFPGIIFGSIAGGSALKFGIYRRKETGAWMTGSSQHQRELSIDEAVQVARRHRDQLILGAELLEQLPEGGSDADYRELQARLDDTAPDVADTAWGHKYLSMLYPNKLDDYHVEHYHRFHLIKLLQVPPEGKGRYLGAGRYMAVAHKLDIPLNHLTTMLNQRDGNPYRYWRIGTTLGERESRWSMMRGTDCVAIGWADLGDLSDVSYNRESKERIRAALESLYPNTPQVIGRKTQEIFNFITVIAEGDLVLPSQGKRVLGIGRVVEGYNYVAGQDMPHSRPVEWLSLGEWGLPVTEGLRTTVHEIRRNNRNLVEIERRLLEAPSVVVKPRVEERPPVTPPRLVGVPGRIQAVLARKGQVIVYGPPGTGKTYWALHTARDLAAYAVFGQPFDELSEKQQEDLHQGEGDRPPRVQMCTFHPAYGYEDFIEGYRPDTRQDRLVFERRDGIFKRLCDGAGNSDPGPFYLVIDEINRGDIPRIFGELLTVLEKDKRGQSIRLPLSGDPFSVPENVYVIGTMNTADRSIALLDTALRRRFGFIELMPDPDVLGDTVVGQSVPLRPWLKALNQRLVENIGRDARNLQIGHAYLFDRGRPVSDFGRFARILEEDILPLLQEYCYEDYTALARILGASFVDEAKQRIRYDLFDPARRDHLIQALTALDPDMVASPEALASEEEQVELEAEELQEKEDSQAE
jgi:5-methylcytosine-specific restriction protein B